MEEIVAFGDWLKQRRRALDLTQEEVARRVGCATVTLKKIEQDERRPSKELAARLAQALEVPSTEQAAFIKVARAELAANRLDTGVLAPSMRRLPSTHPLRLTPATEEAAPAPGAPPFKGLQAFDEADADLFFGREQLTATLVGDLRDHCFLAIVGASGSGKSSLVRAGLIPALQRGEPLADGTCPPEGSAHWPVRIITPGARPLEALALSLTRATESPGATAALADDLARDARSLHLRACKLLSGAGPHSLPLQMGMAAIRLCGCCW